MLNVLDSLKKSKLFRSDQYSYLLYPDRQLPRFTQKNNIPAARIKESELLSRLIADQDSSIVSADQNGQFHFNGNFRNAAVLEGALNQLDALKYAELLNQEKENILAIYEELFDHQSFTGRSGAFYGYEGLGSIYWHMVSKLLLAAQEVYFQGLKEGTDARTVNRIKDHYYEIKAGIGIYKTPDLHGAFPTDAYSHTPAHAGAQQPGMTGQVKEDFLTRMAELGILIHEGKISFEAKLLDKRELLSDDSEFEFFGLDGTRHILELKKGQLAFTFCQLPVIYKVMPEDNIQIFLKNGKIITLSGNTVAPDLSKKVFERTGEIERIEVASVNFMN